MSNGCLTGLRVLDLSQYLPGPYAAQILADLGAGVVKVEPPTGDPMRGLGPTDGQGLSSFYKLINAGKSVVRLDLKNEADKAAFTRLAARADVLIESFRPGVLAKLGFSPEGLRGVNPRLVHCALSGYGQTGPSALKAGHDINYMALGGGLATSGIADHPVMAHPPTADFASGMQAALSVLAALLRRDRSGEGAFIDVSLAETVLGWQGLNLTAAKHPGHEPRRGAALLNGGAACYGIYETAGGGFVTLGALEAKFWANFCRAVDRPDWIERQWEPMPQDALTGEVAALFRMRGLADWNRDLEAIDCCFQAVLEPAEVAMHPQIQARGLVRESSTGVEVLFPALFDGRPPEQRFPFREPALEELMRTWGAD